MPISTDSALPENRVKISEDLRSMNVPTGEQVLGCVGDAWVRRVWFDMPRYCDGTDLSGYTLSVNYRNTDEDEDRYPVNDAVVNADTITFSWLVGAVACAAPGLTSVSIKAQKLNGDTVEHEFNSTIYYFKVLPANTTGAEPIQEYSDAFTTLMLQWQAEVDEAVAEAPKGKLVGTASGTTAQTVNDAWPTTPASAVLYGKSVQDGTPTPENPVPVQVVGAPNQLDIGTSFSQWGRADQNGLRFRTGSIDAYVTGTIDNQTGSITVDTYSTSGYFWAAKEVILQPNTDYYYNCSVGSVKIIGHESLNDGDVGTLIHTGNGSFNSGNYNHWVVVFYPNNFAATGMQLQLGTQVTPYVPYGYIGLQIGESITPIDLQGHTLASLPDGTRDVLRVDSVGRVTLEKYVERLTYNGGSAENWAYSSVAKSFYSQKTPSGEALNDYVGLPVYAGYSVLTDQYQPEPNPQISYADWTNYSCVLGLGRFSQINNMLVLHNTTLTVVSELTAALMANPLTVYMPIATPQTIELGTIELPELTNPCELAIYASLDPEWAITYEQDPNLVIVALQSSIAPVEGSTASTNYAVNSYLIHANQLYRVTSAIATGEAITPGSNCVACTVMGEVIRLTA